MTARRSRPSRAALALLLAASAGCRTYAEIPSQSVDPGHRVRVRLTAAGSSDVAATIGPRGRMLEGGLVSRDDSTLTLSPTVIVRTNGEEERWPGDPVVVRRSAVAGVDAVRTSVRRSALLAGGVVAVLVLLRAAFDGGEGVSRTPGEGPGGGGR